MSTLIEKLEREYKKWCDREDNSVFGGVEQLDARGRTRGLKDAIDIVKQHNDWISVNERLPDSDCYVIVYCDGGNVTKSFFTTDREYLRLSRNSRYTRKAYGKNSGYFAISHDDGYKVTHWQPLPQPPSEVQP